MELRRFWSACETITGQAAVEAEWKRLVGEDYQAAIQAGINKALSIQRVEGVLIIYKGFTGTAGKIPKIIKVAPKNSSK